MQRVIGSPISFFFFEVFEINIDEENYHRGKDYKVLVKNEEKNNEIQETDGVYVVPGSSVETDQEVEM